MPRRYCQKIMTMMHHRCFQEVVASSPLLDPAKKSHHRRVDLETSCLLLLIGQRLTAFVVVHVALRARVKEVVFCCIPVVLCFALSF